MSSLDSGRARTETAFTRLARARSAVRAPVSRGRSVGTAPVRRRAGGISLGIVRAAAFAGVTDFDNGD